MLDLFLTNKYDSQTAVINNGRKYNFSQLKALISGQIEQLKNKKENIVIATDDNFIFIIQFFASVFSNKNIYLLSDKTRLNNLKFDFDTPCDLELKTKENYIFPKVDTKKVIINFYTSGSSSEPKVIKKSLYNLICEGCDINEEFDFKNLEVISTTTMCHLFGMTFHLMTSLCGKLIINTDKIAYPENVNYESSILISTPGFLSSVSKYDEKFKIPPKYIISAGSKLDDKVFEYLEKNSKIIEIYGSTETGVIAHKTHFSDDFTLFKNVEIKSNQDNTQVSSAYSYEEICEINDKIELSGAYLKIKSRTDRMVKIREKRVSLVELESNLKENEFVNSSYAIKHEDKLACLCALSDKGRDFLIKEGIVELTKSLKKHLSHTSEIIPQKWKFIDEIPMNKTGKINKNLIEHIFNVNLSLPVILDRKISQNSIIYKLFFYNQCNFFKGHFEEFKLLPGVVQLFIAKEFANVHFGLNLGAGQWKRIKFSNIIKPDNIVELKLEKSEKNVSFEYSSDENRYSSGVFLCDNIFEKALSKEVL